jgi:transposase-like protein
MRTEEEAKYDLDQTIFEMYDSGSSVQKIAQRLSISTSYIMSTLNTAETEQKQAR